MRVPVPLPSVSVVGLGPIGLPVALNLLRAGVEVTAWNRSPASAQRFADAGGAVSPTPSRLRGEVVLSVLPDVDQLDPLMDGLAASPAATLVVMSTSSPAKVQALAERWRSRLDVADAPVSGGVPGAVAASLSVMVGADDEVFARVEPVLRCLGTTVEHVGPLGAGMLAKLCNQVVVAGTLASLAEAMVLAEAGGVDLAGLIRLFEGGLADSAVLRAKATTMADREYVGGGSTRNQVKDLRYVVETARTLGAPAAMTDVALELFEAALAAGLGDADHSAVKAVLDGRRRGR